MDVKESKIKLVEKMPSGRYKFQTTKYFRTFYASEDEVRSMLADINIYELEKLLEARRKEIHIGLEG